MLKNGVWSFLIPRFAFLLTCPCKSVEIRSKLSNFGVMISYVEVQMFFIVVAIINLDLQFCSKFSHLFYSALLRPCKPVLHIVSPAVENEDNNVLPSPFGLRHLLEWISLLIRRIIRLKLYWSKKKRNGTMVVLDDCLLQRHN